MKVTQRELADVFGVSARTIRAWQADGMPAEGQRKERRYETEDCIAWAAAAGKLGAPDPARENGDGPPSEEVSDRRWKEYRAERKRLEVRERRGELIEFEEVLDLLEDVHTTVRTQLLNLPGRRVAEIAAETDRAAIKEIRMEAVREVLEELQRLARDKAREEVGEGEPV